MLKYVKEIKNADTGKIILSAKILIREIAEDGKEDPRELFEDITMTLDKIEEVEDDLKSIQSAIIQSFTDYNMECSYWGGELDKQKSKKLILVKKLEILLKLYSQEGN